MSLIRRALASEYDELSSLAYRSEAYWGYDSEYMSNFLSVYKISSDFIECNPTFILEEGNTIVGFYSIVMGVEETSLEYFFIEPDSIGKGYGRQLWDHMIDTCKCYGIHELDIVTSPQAEAFYLKMGATPCGEVESLLRKNRKIPRLRYRVEQ